MSSNETLTNSDGASGRLSFLKLFMAEYGITQKEVAGILGKTKCAVSHMFSIVEDMRMSEIEKVLASRGAALKCLITRDPGESVDKYTLGVLDCISVGGELVEPRLYFVLVALKRYGVSREKLASMLGVRSSTVRYWLHTANDTYLSNIQDVARVLGCHLKLRIVDSRQDTEADSLAENPGEGECRMIVETNCVRVLRFGTASRKGGKSRGDGDPSGQEDGSPRTPTRKAGK